MLMRPRVHRLAVYRALNVFAALLALWTVFETLNVRRQIHLSASEPVPPFDPIEKIFIASIHWTSESILRSHWCDAVLSLAQALGPANVFVSVYESGSLDNSKEVLSLLDKALDEAGIPHNVTLDETSHRDEVTKPVGKGWLPVPETKQFRENWTEWFTLEKGEWVPRRISYLAKVRNEALKPLYDQQRRGVTYDRILWLNDVVFETDDIRRLLATHSGSYAAACALDFKKGVFYDTFATRDSAGHAPLTNTWPYFHSSPSRQAVLSDQPIPVSSCWNGAVAFDAAPFYAHVPLEFRDIPDTLAAAHLEGSECCLIHADNPLTRSEGVWINPTVRVGYNGSDYEAVHHGAWPSTWEIATGIWRNRMRRWIHPPSQFEPGVRGAIERWEAAEQGNREVGKHCIIDEMQVLLWNGWGHV